MSAQFTSVRKSDGNAEDIYNIPKTLTAPRANSSKFPYKLFLYILCMINLYR